jgi:hypothetical protein
VSAGPNLPPHIGLIEIRVRFGLGSGVGSALAQNLKGSARLETRTFEAISEKPRTLILRRRGGQSTLLAEAQFGDGVDQVVFAVPDQGVRAHSRKTATQSAANSAGG